MGLDAGLVQEARLHLVPIVLGSGTRLFDGVDPARLRLELTSAIEADGVVHLEFWVREGPIKGSQSIVAGSPKPVAAS